MTKRSKGTEQCVQFCLDDLKEFEKSLAERGYTLDDWLSGKLDPQPSKGTRDI